MDTSSTDVVNLGFTWGWGDLHAHSDLSQDGCRDPASDCAADITRVGLDFFDSAIDEGLDFAAITDHSQWETWSEGGGSTHTINIWNRTREAVADAVAAHPDFIPLLGYEWTTGGSHPVGGYWPGGHRVVLFEDTTACREARLSVVASLSTHTYTKAVDGPVLYGGTPYHAGTYTDLVEAMDTAVADCGITGRVQMVPHHAAYRPPGVVDWANPDSVPDSRYTNVVEQVAIPGDEVTAADADQLVVSFQGLVDGSKWEHIDIDLIDPTGVTLATTEDEPLDLILDTVAGDVLYVRLRLYGTGDTEGERMWLSPWFFN